MLSGQVGLTQWLLDNSGHKFLNLSSVITSFILWYSFKTPLLALEGFFRTRQTHRDCEYVSQLSSNTSLFVSTTRLTNLGREALVRI